MYAWLAICLQLHFLHFGYTKTFFFSFLPLTWGLMFDFIVTICGYFVFRFDPSFFLLNSLEQYLVLL